MCVFLDPPPREVRTIAMLPGKSLSFCQDQTAEMQKRRSSQVRPVHKDSPWRDQEDPAIETVQTPGRQVDKHVGQVPRVGVDVDHAVAPALLLLLITAEDIPYPLRLNEIVTNDQH